MLVQLVRRLVHRAATTAERGKGVIGVIFVTSLLIVYVYFPNSFSNVLHLEIRAQEQKQAREKREKERNEKEERDQREKEKRKVERMEKERRDSEDGSFFSTFADLGICGR